MYCSLDGHQHHYKRVSPHLPSTPPPLLGHGAGALPPIPPPPPQQGSQAGRAGWLGHNNYLAAVQFSILDPPGPALLEMARAPTTGQLSRGKISSLYTSTVLTLALGHTSFFATRLAVMRFQSSDACVRHLRMPPRQLTCNATIAGTNVPRPLQPLALSRCLFMEHLAQQRCPHLYLHRQMFPLQQQSPRRRPSGHEKPLGEHARLNCWVTATRMTNYSCCPFLNTARLWYRQTLQQR
jgi:hypothetical protein